MLTRTIIAALSGGRFAHCQRQRLSSFGTARRY
nr:MAG TPA: hypothetical protein [Caudoviricetes sp.]